MCNKIGGVKRNKNKHATSFLTLGQNIKSKRLLKKLSQEELAFRISSARNYIGCIERGEKAPSVNFLLDIAKELDCKVKDFFIDV